MDLKARIGDAAKKQVITRSGWNHHGIRIMKYGDSYYGTSTCWPHNEDWRGNKTTITFWKSNSLLGPYSFDRDLAAVLKAQAWSSAWLHDCDLEYDDGTFYYFYTGHDGAMDHRAVGIASFTDPNGPWTIYPENPIVTPRLGKWDSFSITNASIYKDAYGRWRMVYKGRTNDNKSQRIGMAEAESPFGPWTGRRDAPNFSPDLNDKQLEDISVWKENGKYWAIMKTFNTIFGVPAHNGILAVSDDGTENSFFVAKHAHGYELSIRYADTNEVKNYKNIEFPFVYVENGIVMAISNGVWSTPHLSGGIGVIRSLSQV